jgi:hypothetical protein
MTPEQLEARAAELEQPVSLGGQPVSLWGDDAALLRAGAQAMRERDSARAAANSLGFLGGQLRERAETAECERNELRTKLDRQVEAWETEHLVALAQRERGDLYARDCQELRERLREADAVIAWLHNPGI